MDTFIKKFKQGTKPVELVGSVDRTILTEPGELLHDYSHKKCVKFIPASGAATRMFKDLYTYLEDGVETDFTTLFFDHLEAFAFYEDLTKGEAHDINTPTGRMALVRELLESKLNYGNKPKALLKVHRYGDRALTPVDEHLYEAEQYLPRESMHLHFTISEEHEDMFVAYVNQVKEDRVSLTYSFQKEKTRTLAVDLHNAPFLLESGEPLYRAGGHGSLIENLNDIDADIIFIKNIDNVCHRDHLKETVASKQELASIGMGVKMKIDDHIERLMKGTYDLDAIRAFIRETLHIHHQNEVSRDIALAVLNRPLRVCGVVKNQGDPGGGPFVVANDGYTDLQICETAEIDRSNPKNEAILSQSQYFNPVDLVCFVRDYRGRKFNLLDFINEERYFISEKTYKGRPLKALEHPGLWNGAMHHWNTLFVEVPLITFNPVKTVNDLLKAGHLPTPLR